MLIENDKRGPNKQRCSYSIHANCFYVPSNVYLIGMMNTADRSLAMLDYALRRRLRIFRPASWIRLQGVHCLPAIAWATRSSTVFIACVSKAERRRSSDDDTLGDGFCIGHSYFCGMNSCRRNRRKTLGHRRIRTCTNAARVLVRRAIEGSRVGPTLCASPSNDPHPEHLLICSPTPSRCCASKGIARWLPKSSTTRRSSALLF